MMNWIKKKLAFPALLMIFILAPVIATADSIDVGNITCGELFDKEDFEIALIYYWLDGYVSSMAKDNIIDTEGIEEEIEVLADICKGQPKTKVISLMDVSE